MQRLWCWGEWEWQRGTEAVGNGVMCGVIVAIKLLRIRLGYGRVGNDRNPAEIPWIRRTRSLRARLEGVGESTGPINQNRQTIF